jgi:protein-S-isoprenylcysteine O-methyltransferase Ste14
MELAPILKLTLLNGGIFLILFYILQFINLTFVQNEMRKKLFDRSKFSKKEWILTFLAKIFGITVMILMFLSPITDQTIEFLIGVGIYILGMVGLRISILNFISTPLDHPVTKGLYKYSRNPQETMLTIIFLGITIIVGSGVILILLIISKIFNHYAILAQEKACILNYGKEYQDYIQAVPRYFLFF